MAEKIIMGRIVQKHDVESNWKNATTFVPKEGEIIVYDKDSTYNYERIKIGDGSTLVSALPFVDDAIKSSVEAVDSRVDDVSARVDSINVFIGDKSVSEQIDTAIDGVIVGLSVSGDTITYVKGDDTTGTIKTQDTKVTQTATTANDNYPLLLAPGGQAVTTTSTAYFDSGVTLNPSTNMIAANISGNASSATKATNDKNGRDISRVYCSMIPAGTVIPASADLNTTAYLKVGNYYCSKNADVSTLKNCPTELAFMMQVYNPLSTAIDNEATSTWVYRLRKIMTHKGVEYYQFVNSGSTAGTFTYGAWIKTINDTDIVTSSKNGIMTAAMLEKLNGIADGATKVTVDSALSSTSTNPVQNKTVNTAISNLSSLLGDKSVSEQIDNAFDDAIIGLSVSGQTITYTRGDGSTGTITTQDTDTVYTHPGYTAKGSGLYKITVDNTGHISSVIAVTKDDITALGIPGEDTDTTYSAATINTAGLMSAADKIKLNGIATGANKITVDSALSSTSTNPVQNNVVNAALYNLSTLLGDKKVSEQIDNAVSLITPSSIGAAPTAHNQSSTTITTGGSEGQICAVNADGTISPNARTISSLGTGAVYSLDGKTLTITTL